MSYYNKGGRGGGGGGNYRGSGGFRGNRGSSNSEWRGSRGGRGSGSSYNSRGGPHSGGGGGTRYFNSPSFDSRPRNSSGPGDKFGGRSRDFHAPTNSYNKDDDYGSRNDYKRSPEPPRKRNRPDSSPNYMGPRRSVERSYLPSGDYQNRNFSNKSGAGGGYLTEKGSYREVRESKPEYNASFRKPTGYYPHRGSGRGRTSVRGSRFRGGSSIGRGFKSNVSLLARRRMESLGVRKKYVGRLDSRKVGSFRSKRYQEGRSREDKSDDEDDLDEDEEIEDEDIDLDEEVEGDEEMEGDEESEEDIEDEERLGKETEDGDEGETVDDDIKGDEKSDTTKDDKADVEVKKEDTEEPVAKKKKDSPKKKIIKKKKVVPKKATPKTAALEIKTEKVEKEDDEDEEEIDETKKEEDKDSDDKEAATSVRLKCPHCRYGCLTFKEYARHLTSKKHLIAMRGLSNVLRTKLTKMRLDQRKRQKILDNEAMSSNPNLKTFYCTVCKLNYKTMKSAHFASSAHKRMKEFLAAYCRICKTAFKSPWAYEYHISELHHMKRKLNRSEKKKADIEDIDLDPSHFMVLDAVGSGDDDESDKSEAEESKEGDALKAEDGSPPKEEKKKKKQEEINLGAEHCKLVEVYFCDLCHIFVPNKGENNAESLAMHCRSRWHLEKYVRFRDDQSLRRRAVKLHKEMEKEKKEEAKKKVQSTVKETASKKTEVTVKSEDEKVWSDVDKELSDLLHDEDVNRHDGEEKPHNSDSGQNGDAARDEAEPEERECNEEDEDSLRGEDERYDRFKKSEKLKKEAKDEGSGDSEEVKGIILSDEK